LKKDRFHVLKWLQVALLLGVGGVIAWFAIAAWFNPLQFPVLVGDDLDSLDAARQSYLASVQWLASYFKFRPVVSLVIWLVTQWSQGDANKMASAGIAIHALNSLIFFFLAYRVLRVPLAISLGLTFIAILNRFHANILSPGSGVAEGIGVTALLCIVVVSTRFLERPTIRRAALLALLFLIIVHIHERFLGLACPLALIAIGVWSRARLPAAVVILGVTASGLLNFGIKKFGLGTPILIGGETRPIDFNIQQICSFLWHGTLNLLGINSGPSYLSLENFSESPFWIQFVSVAAAVLSCCLVAKVILDAVLAPAGETRKAAFVRLGFFVLATALLLLSASITFRQEYRWLYSPYLVFLCLLALAVRRAARLAPWPHLLMTCLLVLSVSREIYLRRRLPNLFYFYSEQVASNLFYTLQHVSGIREKDAVVIHGNVPDHEWVFLGNGFSRFYHFPRLEFASGPAVAEETDGTQVVVVDYNGADNSFTVAQPLPPIQDRGHTMNYAVLEQVAATLTPDPRVSTPTKTQLFAMPENGVMCMVAVAPLEITVAPPTGTRTLRVCLSHVYALGDGVDVEIDAISASSSATLLARQIPPLPNNDFPVWRKYELALPVGTEKVQLHVLSKSGDPTADWVGLRDFSFE
jgi:hypothetical protein